MGMEGRKKYRLSEFFDYGESASLPFDLTATQVFWSFLAISLFPLLFHLDTTGFIEDEGIRNLVALEMDLSGNYFAPTLYGEAYLNKPPLWNWILLLTYKITGGPGVFNARLASIFFLLLFCATIFYGLRKQTGEKIALLSALIFLTCGRILFWDSLLSLIDICFSWVIFCMFLWIYHYGSKKRFGAMYSGAYALATVAFFLKALPALVFLGFSLIAAMLYWKEWRKLFALSHFLSFFLLALPLGLYLYIYNQTFPAEDLVLQYFSESTKRTAAEHSFGETLLHLALFPLEMMYHFFPWTLLLFMYLSKGAFASIRKNSFLLFGLLLFAANIWVYWTSPNVFPRYLFMFFPLLFTPAIYLYFSSGKAMVRKIIDILFLLLTFVFIAGSWAPHWVEDAQQISSLTLKSGLLTLMFIAGLILFIAKPGHRLFTMACMLLVVRLGFDFFVLPPRDTHTWEGGIRKTAMRVSELVKNEPLHILRFDHLTYNSGFYLTRERGEIITQSDSLVPGSFMIIEKDSFRQLELTHPILDSLQLFEKNRHAYVVRIPGVQ